MSLGGTVLAALLATLIRPGWWLTALASFLVRGGILLFIAAIVTLPTPAGLSDLILPIVQPGGLTSAGVVVAWSGPHLVLAWLSVGGWLAAMAEVALIRSAAPAAVEEGVVPGPPPPAFAEPLTTAGRLAIRVTAARILAHLPTALVLALGSVAIVNIAYAEVTRSINLETPVVLRVVQASLVPLAVILATWLAGETVGGLAARRLILGGAAIGSSLASALSDLTRRPGGWLAGLATTVVLGLDLAAILATDAFLWGRVRLALIDPTVDGAVAAIGSLAFALAWTVGLALTGLIAAWRSGATTFLVVRSLAEDARLSTLDTGGTFGAPDRGRPGDWSAGGERGSL
jgi:hypothetical protein